MIRTKRERNLTTGALFPQILLFALPLIATSVLQLMFNTADTIVVGRWGSTDALAAVGSCASLINLCVNLFFGLAAGAGICVAHDIGAGHEEEVSKTVHTSVVLSLISGAIVTVIGLLFSGTFLSLMGTDDSILDEATAYMRVYFLGMPANMLYNYCAAILRSKGDTVRPLIFLSTAGVVNVIFNLIAVIVLDWGAVGVGAATAISQWVSCALIVIYMTRMTGVCRIELKKLRADPHSLKRILRIGIPTGIQSSLFSIANVLIQSALNSLEVVAIVSGNTAASSIDSYIYATQNSLYHAALTFVAQNRGARNISRIKKSILLCALTVVLVGILVGSVVYMLAEPLLSFYVPDNAENIDVVVSAGRARLLVMAATYFLCGLMEVGTGAIRGLGRSFLPMIVSLIGSCALRIVWIYTVFAFTPVPDGFHFSFSQGLSDDVNVALFRLFILYLSYPVTWAITASVHFLCTAIEIRKFRRRHIDKTA